MEIVLTNEMLPQQKHKKYYHHYYYSKIFISAVALYLFILTYRNNCLFPLHDSGPEQRDRQIRKSLLDSLEQRNETSKSLDEFDHYQRLC